MRGQVDLVDDQQVAAGDPRSALARDLVAGGHVDDVDGDVGQFGAEGGRQVVAARFDQDQVQRRKFAAQFGHARQVDAGVLADRRVWAAARLDAHDPLRRQRPGARQELRVFLGVDVVGDGCDVVERRQGAAQPIHQRRLPRANGAADTDAQGTVGAHVRNNLVYCVSCRMAAMSERKHAPPMSSSAASAVSAAMDVSSGASSARMRNPAV